MEKDNESERREINYSRFRIERARQGISIKNLLK
ncbi:MAG: hypothetical protein H6Q60_10 [Oscillospiraceae bacterium]|nr:hypothetical protein [Oscillospiraceae bacterium]